MPKLPQSDLTGCRFGDWQTLGYDTNGCWTCVCVCGERRAVSGTDLRKGKSKGCGCRKARECAERLTQHGLAYTSEYFIWHGMIRRCYNPRATGYEYYGGRSIKVCERWRESLTDFVEDMGPRPSLEHTIDRIDYDGDYEPGNCRWATRKEQGQNTSFNRNLTFGGQTLCVSEWARVVGLKGGTIQTRLQRGWSVERALTEPVNRK